MFFEKMETNESYQKETVEISRAPTELSGLGKFDTLRKY